MAQHTEVRYVDDIDGSDAEGAVEFSIDGKNYEIDLSASNAARLRDALAEFIAAGRPVVDGKNGRVARRTSDPRQKSDPQLNQAIREWAAGNGVQVSERGRLPKHVKEAYEANDPSLLAATG